ncbi:MAG: PorP/SprF family type IX secretion system membrane protein [Bacteroidia bacterium]|nr:PorP/SprF family type IX secretion system membrane protein [Bacteroidia bacterium]MCF8428016.1 PorP/SprF family type IX secretion system membrane protein [Bacteroidia bacterium]MCF8445740.1 PorP/SprF family type IX secretion system membrane protein [Bacteroidia bacterium]
MKTSKIILASLIGMTCFQAKAQLTYGNEQFIFNPVMVTPSLAGNHNNQIKLGYDARWVGIEGAPKTAYLNYDRFFNGNTGWNISVITDKIGPISTISLANAFSFSVKTSDETKLAFGIKHHISQSTLNVDIGNIIDPTDQLLASNQTGVPVNNFDASIAWLNPNMFMVGFSYRNLIPQPRFRFTNTIIDPILSLHGWYNYDFGDASLEAFLNINATSNTPINSQIGVMGAIQHKFGVGLNFSPKNQLGIFAFIKATEKLNVFYNYNMPISDIAKASKQSHGIGISYKIGNETPIGNTFFIQPTNESVRSRMF